MSNTGIILYPKVPSFTHHQFSNSSHLLFTSQSQFIPVLIPLQYDTHITSSIQHTYHSFTHSSPLFSLTGLLSHENPFDFLQSQKPSPERKGIIFTPGCRDGMNWKSWFSLQHWEEWEGWGRLILSSQSLSIENAADFNLRSGHSRRPRCESILQNSLGTSASKIYPRWGGKESHRIDITVRKYDGSAAWGHSFLHSYSQVICNLIPNPDAHVQIKSMPNAENKIQVPHHP